MKRRTLPLAIDIGTTRIRALEAEPNAGEMFVRAVAVRELSAGSSTPGCLGAPEYIATLLEDTLAELGTRERRCVCAIGEPDALLRPLVLPKMTMLERERAAKFEAQRHVDYPVEEAVVRIHAIDTIQGLWALGVARSSAIDARLAALRAAGLKPVGIDHEACALVRALPGYDAILDIGYQRTSLHVVTKQTPVTLHAYNGGADVTRAIERDLSIDTHSAEKRKRILATAGAGERARAALASDITSLIAHARATQAISRVAVVGNAARLAGITADIELATGASCEIPVSEVLRRSRYPEDVIRSSAPDWTLAAGLALWSASAHAV